MPRSPSEPAAKRRLPKLLTGIETEIQGFQNGVIWPGIRKKRTRKNKARDATHSLGPGLESLVGHTFEIGNLATAPKTEQATPVRFYTPTVPFDLAHWDTSANPDVAALAVFPQLPPGAAPSSYGLNTDIQPTLTTAFSSQPSVSTSPVYYPYAGHGNQTHRISGGAQLSSWPSNRSEVQMPDIQITHNPYHILDSDGLLPRWQCETSLVAPPTLQSEITRVQFIDTGMHADWRPSFEYPPSAFIEDGRYPNVETTNNVWQDSLHVTCDEDQC